MLNSLSNFVHVMCMQFESLVNGGNKKYRFIPAEKEYFIET